MNHGLKEYYVYIKGVYKRLSRFYDVTRPVLGLLRRKVAALTDMGDGGNILDVCSGTGGQAIAYVKDGREVVGIDLSPEMVDVARGKAVNGFSLAVADAANLPFKDCCFKLTVISFALHDMPHLIRAMVLREIVRVTVPGGLVVVVDYSLPRNRVLRLLAYSFIKLYETRYFSGFVRSGLEKMVLGERVRVIASYPALLNLARIVVGKKS